MYLSSVNFKSSASTGRYFNSTTSFKRSTGNNEQKAAYVKKKLDEYDSNSKVFNTANFMVDMGLILLAFDKMNASFKDLKKSEKLGWGLFLLGGAVQLAFSLKHACLASDYKKQYDKENA